MSYINFINIRTTYFGPIGPSSGPKELRSKMNTYKIEK